MTSKDNSELPPAATPLHPLLHLIQERSCSNHTPRTFTVGPLRDSPKARHLDLKGAERRSQEAALSQAHTVGPQWVSVTALGKFAMRADSASYQLDMKLPQQTARKLNTKVEKKARVKDWVRPLPSLAFAELSTSILQVGSILTRPSDSLRPVRFPRLHLVSQSTLKWVGRGSPRHKEIVDSKLPLEHVN